MGAWLRSDLVSNQQAIFQARVKRINDPKNDSYLDPELGIRVPKRLSKKIIKTNNAIREQKAGTMSLIFSILLGAVCLMAARYVRFHYADIPETGTAPLTLMIMDYAMASVMVFVAGGLIKHKSIRHMGAQIAGMAAMLVAMHNLIWFFPTEFAQVYSQSYVDQVIAATEPLSIFVNGASITVL